MIEQQENNFDGAGNFYNKYESRNPLIKRLIKKYFSDLNSILSPVKAEIQTALEVGCGEGYVSEFLYELGIPVEGTDVSPRIIEIAKKNHPHIEFSVLSIYDLDMIKKRYDLVVANEVLEHLMKPDEAIEKMKIISRKYIMISVPNEPYFRIANIIRLKYLCDAGNTPGHINHWSKSQLKKFLVSGGLTIKSIKSSTLWTLALCEKSTTP